MKWIFTPMLLVAIGSAAAAPSASNGKALSGVCAGCHGNEGIATNSSYPNLAGQNYQYLVTQLQNFKSGQRKNQIMHSMMFGLSKQQIEDLAAYFSGNASAYCNH